MSRHDKDYNSSVKLSAYADLMLDRIDTCISDKISKSVTRLASAIVTKVNSDGSVNIRLPSEDNTEFTKIQNQCPYELKIGDAVELTLKNGSFNNCWVSAKHGMGTRATSNGSSGAYVLPVATATQLGGIKVGAGLVISNGVLSVTGGGTADAVEWKNVLNTPTTLAGYGITDARINSGTITLGGNSIVPLTASSNLDATKLVGNVPSATKAIQDGNGDVIVDTYAKKTDIPSLSEYATQTWVQNQGYLTQHQDISGLATKLELQTVEDKIPTIPTKVSAFENDVGYLTQHQSLANYALKSELPKNVSDLTNDAKYITASGAPVQSVNGKSGAVELTSSDVGALPTSGGTLTGNLKVGSANIQTNGYIVGTWLQGTTPNHLTTAATKIAVQDGSGWVYHRTAKEIKSDIGLGNVDNVKQYSASNPPPYPVTSVNGKVGSIELAATDVGAISAADISQTLGNSSTKVPSEKAVVDAMSAAGYGDMLKAKYANNSTDDTVDKAFSDANGKNIADTYVPKDGGTLNNVDANTLITTGNYLIGEGCTNFPDGSQGSVVQVVGAGGSAYQTTVIYATNTYAHRAYNGTTWTAWKDANGAVVSATQPQYQNVGSLWFEENT